MKNLSLKQIIEITNGKLIKGDLNYQCKNYSKDTRTIKKGDTYIAIKGETFDGNKFWKQALEKGADCVIVSDLRRRRKKSSRKLSKQKHHKSRRHITSPI